MLEIPPPALWLPSIVTVPIWMSGAVPPPGETALDWAKRVENLVQTGITNATELSTEIQKRITSVA